ncbi:MAG: glutamine-hydrolyzing carbamoyl-phosphate synthase small subunit [Candidatus Krumholzibacteria bacterium]|nr:glutamine-hydrolyzing carbamoyl-phosphate synthase small subunit [Candidatus Krumholzibacteria bacterium]
MGAWIALETGRVFRGKLLGAPLEAGGEAVFHTGMTGYQEILTDPSYAGQVVVFTAAHIGNYGIHRGDHESQKVHPAAVIVRDYCRRSFHRHSEQTLDQVLRQAGVPALADVDTRALTIAIRDEGTCRAWIGSGDPDELVAKARALPPIADIDWVSRVTTPQMTAYPIEPETDAPCEVAVLDCGVTKSILDRLVKEGCRVRVFPASTPAAELLAGPTEGVFLSNGPGDPASQLELVRTVSELLKADLPLFGICLGHQLLARALGGTTVKLPFGHHGANHPVQNLATGRIEITSQNHNYAVPTESLDPQVAVPTHLSLNDGSVEGLQALGHSAYSVQFHPEAAPGPSDSLYLFARFTAEMLQRRETTALPEMKKHAASQ